MLLSTAIAHFLDSMTGARADSTVVWYRHRLSALVSYLGDREIRGIATEDLEAYRAALSRKDGLSAYTIHGHCRAIRALWKWLQKRHHLDRNVALDVALPRLPANPPKHIERSDIARLLEAARTSRDRALILVLAASGCRVGSVASLTRDAIDLQHGIIVCHEKFDYTNTYYLNVEAQKALGSWLEENRSEYVWPSTKDGPLTTSGIYQIIKRIAKRAGIAGRWNPHSFRHQKARELLENGASLADVADILNHRDTTVTAKFYARWTKEEVHKRFHQFSAPTYGTNGTEKTPLGDTG